MLEKVNVNTEHLVKAPLTGQIIDIKVAVGDVVSIGQDLATLTAMKMENIITAQRSATVSAVHVKAGDQVNMGQVLIEFVE